MNTMETRSTSPRDSDLPPMMQEQFKAPEGVSRIEFDELKANYDNLLVVFKDFLEQAENTHILSPEFIEDTLKKLEPKSLK